MKIYARLYQCALCYRQVIICSDCDRGNIYCKLTCSQQARKESLKNTRRRYQNTKIGRHKHAARQKRYRLRQKEKMIKVTDQGSHEKTTHDLLTSESNNVKKDIGNHKVYCHFCNRNCSLFLRTGFLQRLSNNKIVFWPRAP
jgi:hypothetical protein